jgi:hypothetical protein
VLGVIVVVAAMGECMCCSGAVEMGWMTGAQDGGFAFASLVWVVRVLVSLGDAALVGFGLFLFPSGPVGVANAGAPDSLPADLADVTAGPPTLLAEAGDFVHVDEEVAVEHAVGEGQEGFLVGVCGEDGGQYGAEFEERGGPCCGAGEECTQDAEERHVCTFGGGRACFDGAGQEGREDLLDEGSEEGCETTAFAA